MEKMFRFRKKRRVRKISINESTRTDVFQNDQIETLKLNGTYETEKVVVEWEREFYIENLYVLLTTFLGVSRTVQQIRIYLSEQLQDTDKGIRDQRISNYKLNLHSLNEALELLQNKDLLKINSPHSSNKNDAIVSLTNN